MRSVLHSLLLVSAFVAGVAVPAAAAADSRPKDGFVLAQGWGRDHDRARDGVRAGQLLPLEVVLSNVAARFPGHHLAVDGPFRRDGRWIYRIKWLTPDGRVLIVFADAETGQVLDVRG